MVIDLVIEKNDVLCPIEIKTSTNPMKGMAKNFPVLHNIPDKEIGIGCALCQYDGELYFSENPVFLQITYI